MSVIQTMTEDGLICRKLTNIDLAQLSIFNSYPFANDYHLKNRFILTISDGSRYLNNFGLSFVTILNF